MPTLFTCSQQQMMTHSHPYESDDVWESFLVCPKKDIQLSFSCSLQPAFSYACDSACEKRESENFMGGSKKAPTIMRWREVHKSCYCFSSWNWTMTQCMGGNERKILGDNVARVREYSKQNEGGRWVVFEKHVANNFMVLLSRWYHPLSPNLATSFLVVKWVSKNTPMGFLVGLIFNSL